MPFPQHPGKPRWTPVFSAADFHRYPAARRGRPGPRAPPSIVTVFGSRWKRYLPRACPGTFDAGLGIHRVKPTVGIVLVDGPGAPFAAMIVEELAASGARRFVIVGLAGSLQSRIPAGALVLCTKAVRDEGTSHHYQESSRFARPDGKITKLLQTHLERLGCPCTRGASWTTDAIYRETREEIRRYREAGVVTVDMEAAAVLVVARLLGAKAAALFVISDHVDERGWEPRFHDSRRPLRQALRWTLAALAR